jgi:hypothetical protein
MVTWAQVRRWSPTAIGGVADALNERCNRLLALNADVEQAGTVEGWLGDAAVAASTRGNSLISTLESRIAEACAVRRGAHEAQIAVERIVTAVADTDALAGASSWVIGGDGAVVAPPATGPPPPPDVAAQRERVRVDLADRVEQILRRARDVDADLARILTGAVRGEITQQGAGKLPRAAGAGTGQGGTSIIGPSGCGTPGDNRAWWDSLSDTERATVLRDTPDWVRNLDGIPVLDRDSANRTALQREIANLQTRAGELALTDPADWVSRDELHRELDGLRAIAHRLSHPDPVSPQAFLLGLDTTGDGKAIVASGNPDTARNVATYVPGVGSGLSTIGSEVDRSDKMWQSATAAGSPSTAVVTWIGYDAPDDLADAGGESHADAGGGALSGFQDGLRASHEGAPSHNTVLGYSYGTTVVGHAARDGALNADELVFVASPGVGVRDVNGLHLDGVAPADIGHHVHATVAEHDLIHLTNVDTPIIGDPALGPDPATRRFGGQLFESAPGTEGPGILGGLSTAAHSQYWEDRSPSLRNFGLIIAGGRGY